MGGREPGGPGVLMGAKGVVPEQRWGKEGGACTGGAGRAASTATLTAAALTAAAPLEALTHVTSHPWPPPL